MPDVQTAETSRTPSPWWYRNRGSVIGVIFGSGFFFGNIRFNASTPSLPAAIAWLTRLAGTAYLRGEVVFAPDVQRDRLIVSGIFRYVRNPLYLGNDLLAIGIGLYAPPLGFAIIVLGNVIFGAMLANEEVQQLGAQYGAEYAAYRAAVPAFLPRLTPVPATTGAAIEPSYRAAFFAESFALVIAIALVPVAVAGQAGVIPGAIIFVIAIPLFLAASRMGRRGTKA